jgi:hypothetical protein
MFLVSVFCVISVVYLMAPLLGFKRGVTDGKLISSFSVVYHVRRRERLWEKRYGGKRV